jgi:hypothetical protein
MRFLMPANRWLPIAALALIATAAAVAPGHEGRPAYRSNIPAGEEVLLLKPSGATLSLLGLVECAELEGAQRVAEGTQARLVDADGASLKKFPQHFSFRVTASLKKLMLSDPEDAVTITEAPQDFLLKIKFRMRAFDGIHVREIEPESVRIIGVPEDIPYDERVYRISFNVKDLPVTDRLILDVLTPEGRNMTHFTFGLL